MKREKDYRLWREYLKSSNKYKRFCQLLNEGYIIDKKAPEYKGLKSSDRKILFDVHLQKTWGFWGDVFNKEFKDWWPPKMPTKIKAVVELGKAIKDPTITMTLHMARSRKQNRTVLSIDELAKMPDPECVYVRIRMTDDVTLDDIAKELAELRKKKKKKGLIKSEVIGLISSSDNNQYYKPTGKIYHEKLEDYLKIYELKKKLTWKEVMEQHPLNHISVKEIENRKRTYQLYKQKALEIIKNVEEGRFPGEY